jgi:hypothetical protein
MAQNLITNGENGLSVRNDINNNFSELYTFTLSTNKFQPVPDYADVPENQSRAVVAGWGAFYRESSTVYNQGGWMNGGGNGIAFNATFVNGGLANKWAFLNDDGEGGNNIYATATTTGGTYPWNVSYDSAVITREAAARVFNPLSGTASEGTSIYAARADHTHIYPTPAQIGAAPVVNGLIPSEYIPTDFNDVVEYFDDHRNFPNATATITSTRTISGYGIGGDYIKINNNGRFDGKEKNVYRKYFADNTDLVYLDLKVFTGYFAGSYGTRWSIVDSLNNILARHTTGEIYTHPWSIGSSGWTGGGIAVALKNNSIPTNANGKLYIETKTGNIYRFSYTSLGGSYDSWGYYEVGNVLLQNINVPDSKASIEVSPQLERPFTVVGTAFNRPRYQNIYTFSFVNQLYEEYDFVYYDGTKWVIELGDRSSEDPGPPTYYYSKTGSALYPWLADWTDYSSGNFITKFEPNYITHIPRVYTLPLPLESEAATGISSKAAREDHVHPLPTTLSTNLTATGAISLSGLPTYATNSAAVAGGLLVNRIYKTSTGELRIVI